MSTFYAYDVRLILERERSTGATFDSAWATAMAERPTPADWTAADTTGAEPIVHMRSVFADAYDGQGVDSSWTPDLLGGLSRPIAKNPSARKQRWHDPLCVSGCGNERLSGDRWCAEHRAILDRVRNEVDSECVRLGRKKGASFPAHWFTVPAERSERWARNPYGPDLCYCGHEFDAYLLDLLAVAA